MKIGNFLAVLMASLVLLFIGCSKNSKTSSNHIDANSVTIIDTDVDLEIRDRRLVKILETLKQKADIKDSVILRRFDSQHYKDYGNGNAVMKLASKNPNTYIIYVSRYYYDGAATENSITATLAHELGHLKRRHCEFILQRKNLLTPKERIKIETEADKFALQLVGKKVFEDGLRELERFLYMGPDGDKRADERLTMIKNLH